MNTQSDQQLLAEYAESRSETAFAELVRRHVDLVYSAAMRMVCETHTAQDVSQNVFVALAGNAAQLTGHPVLSGWLHRTTRNLAAKAVRTEVRRQAREQEAAAMNELLANDPGASWEEIAPHLDGALTDLSEADRDAVMLRYFEKKSAPEMAQILGISDEAAQKRLNRAVERLRENFTKRNVTAGAGAFTVLITANAVQAAPIGLAASITSAITVTGAAAAATSTLVTVTKTIAMTTLQKIIVTATVAVLAGAGIYEATQAAKLRDQVQTMQQSQTDLSNQLAAVAADDTRLSNQVAQVKEQKALSQAQFNELLKLRGQKGQSQTALKELAKMQAANKQTGAFSEIFSNALQTSMALSERTQEKKAAAKLARMKEQLHLTDDQAQAINDIMMQRIQENSQRAIAAMSGQAPTAGTHQPSEDSQIQALLTPDQLAAYPDFQQSEKQADAMSGAKAEVALMQNSMDLTPDQQSQAQAALYQYRLNQSSGSTNQAALIAQATANGNLAQSTSLAVEMEKQEIANKIKLMSGILTPDQLKAYQQSQQDMLDMVGLGAKMFQPTTNGVTAGAQ